MNALPRRAFVAAALLAIAGCSGGTSPQSGSLPSQNAQAFLVRGMPFAAPVLHRNVGPNTGGYSTKKSLVFEADLGDYVNIYRTADLASNPPPIATIYPVHGCPYGIVADKKGTIYVADSCSSGSFTGDVEEFAKGSTTLKTTITNGISNPGGLAMDKKGNLYVSNMNPASITVYPFGSTTPSETITGGGMSSPFGLALDKSGNLYIADFGASAVFELPAGGSTVTNLNLTNLGEPLGLAVDQKNGLLWETGGQGNVINIYKLGGSTSPIKTITGNGGPYAISVENKGKPKGEIVESDANTYSVYAFMPGTTTPYATLTNGIGFPSGLLITKP